MRYDDLAKAYCTEKAKAKYIDELMVNVTDLGTTFALQQFGSLKEENYIIRTTDDLGKKITFFEIEGVAYNVLKRVGMCPRYSYYVSIAKGGIPL